MNEHANIQGLQITSKEVILVLEQTEQVFRSTFSMQQRFLALHYL
jgi:hypothetical protein